MNRHELGDKIARETLDSIGDGMLRVALQKRPYTCAQIEYEESGRLFVGLGFSKVNWPDKWNSDYGLEIAVRKAAHDIARQICEGAGMVLEEATPAP